MAKCEQCDVLLVFVNEIEKNAVYEAFCPKTEDVQLPTPGEVLTYHKFPEIGGA